LIDLISKKQVSIIGVGLIGGSIALSIKDEFPEYDIVGIDTELQFIHEALSLGVIDWGTIDLAQGIENADFIIIATPVKATENIIKQLKNIKIKESCIITDVGSTKHNIYEMANCFRDKGISFIGGHPMAGSERSGVKAANRRLFENAYYVLTPSEWTKEADIQLLIRLLESTKAEIITMSSTTHDQVVGAISHLPHIVASALVNLIREKKNNPYYTALAAGGFRDITRIASSSVDMWRDIVISNKDSMLQIITDLERHISDIKKAIEINDIEQIESFFTTAKNFRDDLPIRQQSLIHQAYQINVDVSDHPGAIGNIASVLGRSSINIRNIYINHNREHGEGAMRLTFITKEFQKQAYEVLTTAGYNVQIEE
jgi:prephenate dehydrogenase